MYFILENYLIIILVGLFFVFALIGYLIDTLKNNNVPEKEHVPENIKPIEIKNLNLNKEKEIKKEDNDSVKNIKDADDLLKNYDEDITE